MLKHNIYIKGDIWTNFGIQDLDSEGVEVHLSGNVYFCGSKERVPIGNQWLPKSVNKRYSIKNKRKIFIHSLPEKVSDIITFSTSKNFNKTLT